MRVSEAMRGRFWAKVEKSRGCWRWTAATWDGYGLFDTGLVLGTRKAHRVSWTIHNGSIPRGKQVLHACDVRHCVRPDHLFIGTNADNCRDKIAKGRHAHGEKMGASKLTEAKVRRMFAMRAEGKLHREIAEAFGIASPTATLVLNRKRWKHVSIP